LIRLSGSLKSVGIIVEFERKSNKREIKITNQRMAGTDYDDFDDYTKTF